MFIGTDAGRNSTTPNVGLATDTSCIFIGNQAGRDADNIANTIAVGTNAGYNAYNSSRSIYIGSNAGAEMHGNDNIGIGAHAVRGSGVSSVGTRNIEIVAGLLDNQRLMYSSGNLSDALNIQNTIAGNTNAKKISVGHATLNPDAPFSVRRNTVAVPEHATNDMIQSWWCEGVKVAHIDCSGRFVGNMFVEGVASGIIAAPTSPSSPTTGTMTVKNSGWQDVTNITVQNKNPGFSVSNNAYIQAVFVNGTYRLIRT
ncbi:MAG: hypothetical protein EB059_10840 [Alphaproteobacteria bacterium]|nr:hypothetical protein [Alphaproteobacteria bacterium]